MAYRFGQRFFFVLASLARSSINMGFFERPLVSAFILGLLSGELELALSLGIFLELFWLDFLRLGAVVPPSGTLSFILLFSLSLIHGWQEPMQLAIPLLFCVSFAYSASWLEKWQRRQNDILLEGVQAWAEWPNISNLSPKFDKGKNTNSDLVSKCISPDAVMTSAFWRTLWSYGLLFLFCFVCLHTLFSFLQNIHALPLVPGLSWPMLYGMGLTGAVLALRNKRAYAVLLMGMAWIILNRL